MSSLANHELNYELITITNVIFRVVLEDKVEDKNVNLIQPSILQSTLEYFCIYLRT